MEARGLKHFMRALRLPFITASILPFIAGSLLAKTHFNTLKFSLGFLAVAATHLGANLMNDYADSKSGADWQDRSSYGFFGGSKLIQDGIFSEGRYLRWSVVFLAMSALSVISLALIMKSLSIIFYSAAILLLAVSYSHKPLQLSYRRTGEAVIFILFGPAAVMGGYFIQTGIFPSLDSFMVSLPFGLFTTALLFANEVPDYPDDLKAGKMNWVSITGNKRAFVLYGILVALAFFFVAVDVFSGYLNMISFLSFILIMPAIRASRIMRDFPEEKARLVESSRLTVALQALAGIFIIIGAIR
jgi:1,4-dihydroxy-2-naphthoate octaprenyltransferase